MSTGVPLGRHLIFWSLAILGCVADLTTKWWVFQDARLHGGAIWWFWEGHVGIQQSLNEGALFGLGQGKVWLFAIFSLAAAIAIPIWLFRYRAAHNRWLTITLGFLFGGVLGNLYDRLGLPGLTWQEFAPNRSGPVYAVRDWILWSWDYEAGWIWPNFNIADTMLVCGASAIFLHALFHPEAKDLQ